MKIKNNLLILERSAGKLELNKSESGSYVLEGIFGEIDVKNKNNRIYTESEYVPQIEALQDKIKSSKSNKPTLVEVIIPEKDLAGQMKNLTPQIMNCNN